MSQESDFSRIKEVINRGDNIGIMLHVYLRERFPNMYKVANIDSKKWNAFKDNIEQFFQWKSEHRINWKTFDYDGNPINLYCIHLQNGITLHYDSQKGIGLIYDFESDLEVVEKLKVEIEELEKIYSKLTIGFVQSEMSTLRIRFREFKPYENDVTKYFGNEFVEFKKQLIDEVNQSNRSGLYLLHGKPGTGKTSFIKSVLSEIEKRAIFITPALTESLTSPELVGLLMDHPESIIIIEDAETVLIKRQADNSSAVSNLLNLTDGFPADFLNLNIICTFNTNIDNIDPALLREGRLSGIREFQKLNPDQANSLAKEMGYTLNTKSTMTLAEVCNATAKKYQTATNGIGF